MRLSLAWAACLTSLAAVLPSAVASSTRDLPLSRFSHATDIDFELVAPRHASHPRAYASPLQRRSAGELLATDSFRLSMRAFGQDFHLHLEPNDDIVHPDGAVVRYYAPDGSIERQEKILPGDVRAYHGVVVHPEWSRERMAEDRAGLRRDLGPESATESGVMGRAAIVVHDDGSDSSTPSFEGSFSWNGNTHFIQLAQDYESSRSEHDPAVSKRSIERGSLVVHRNSDIMSAHEARALGIRAAVDASDAAGCSSDGHEYNLNNPLIFSSKNNNEFSAKPVSFFAVHKDGSSKSRRSLYPNLAALLGRSDDEAMFERDAASLVGAPDLSRRFAYHHPLVRRQSTGGDIQTGNSLSNDSYIDNIGSTTGCPTTVQVIYVGMASDCTYTESLGGQDNARRGLLSRMNDVSNLYRTTFRIAVGVVQLDVRSPTCPGTPPSDAQWNQGCGSDTIDQRLSQFSQWRGNQEANGTGLWHLLTTCATGSEVGVAWLGTVCKTDASGSGGDVISGTGVTSQTPRDAQVIAHEMGHNFGAIHDCSSSCTLSGQTASQSNGATCCPQSASTCNDGGNHIMSPVSQPDAATFSPCSVGNVCSLLARGLDTSCIVAPGQRQTLSVQQCGNGIIEDGEECDAGTSGSRCCSADCKLTSGSVCDPDSSACCTDSCQFASAGTVCRPAIDDRCDTAETCPGGTSACPADVRKSNGESCGNGLSCAAGHCTSRDLQCQQQGSELNLQQACPVTADNACSVSCRNPRQANSCIVLQQNFIDGTACGYGGFCEGGSCKAGSWQDTFRGWYTNNLRISIPVTIVVGIIVLLILWAIARCIINACTRHNRSHKVPASRAWSRAGGDNTYGPPPQHPSTRMSQQRPPYAGGDGYDTYMPPTHAPPSQPIYQDHGGYRR